MREAPKWMREAPRWMCSMNKSYFSIYFNTALRFDKLNPVKKSNNKKKTTKITKSD